MDCSARNLNWSGRIVAHKTIVRIQMSMQPAMRLLIYADIIASIKIHAAEALACWVLVDAHGTNDWSIVSSNQNLSFRAVNLRSFEAGGGDGHWIQRKLRVR